MIADKDRSYYIGASDTDKVVGNWNTATFKKWYLEKLKLTKNTFTSKAMKVGTAWEHKILDTKPGVEKDAQIIIEGLGLRVNYDGTSSGSSKISKGAPHIYEVKTYSAEEYKVSKSHWRQAQVEIFAYFQKHKVLPTLSILAYQVTEEDYQNYFRPVALERLSEHPIEYDEEFIAEYVPKLKHLNECIRRGVMPQA